MHSFDAPSGTTYFHNGDFSGFIEYGDSKGGYATLPFADLKALVAEYVRRERISAVEGQDSDVDEVSRLEEMTDDEVLGLSEKPATPPRVFKVQPAPFVDNLFEGGHEGTKLPYPFFFNESGQIQDSSNFWRGRVVRAVGFQRDLTVHEVNLWWRDALDDPQCAVGMYLVTTDSNGGMGVHETAVQSMTEL